MLARYANAGDYVTLVEMRKALSEEERGSVLSDKEVLTIFEQTAVALRDGNVVVVVVEDGTEIIGMMWCFSGSVVGPSEGVMRTDLLYIRPEYRKSRAMGLIWKAVHKTARASNVTLMQGIVLSKNEAVLSMWQKRGGRVRALIVEKETESDVKSVIKPKSGSGQRGGSVGLGEDPSGAVSQRPDLPAASESESGDHVRPSDLRAEPARGSIPQSSGACESVCQ